jgi:hypothetical protein
MVADPEGKPGRGFVTDETEPDPTPASAFSEIGDRFAEARDYASYYVKARVDRIKVTARNVAVLAALGVVGLIAGAALVITAVVMLCVGIALGLSALFGGRMWLGDLVTAIILLGAIGAGAYVGISRLTKTSKERMVRAYEQRKREQRDEHGTDVHERAQQQRAE